MDCRLAQQKRVKPSLEYKEKKPYNKVMFIQTEATPNPVTLKFIPEEPVLPRGTADFTDAKSAAASPLAARLFSIEGVCGVFLGRDFISVTRTQPMEWQHLKAAILEAIAAHYASGDSIIDEAAQESSVAPDESLSEGDSEVVTRIKALLDDRIRPAVAMDGGDIRFSGYDKGIVYLQMRGACAGCPSSTATLKAGIENMLRHYVPEVQEVRATI